MGSRNWRTGLVRDTTDPDLKPVSQSEISFGAEKKITRRDLLQRPVRLQAPHPDDRGRGRPDAGRQGNYSEQYYIANPGEGWTPARRPRAAASPTISGPPPRRSGSTSALNLALEKRFSNNWQGGVNYTWSQMKGNYGGLSSSDENGRNSPNVERYWDLWFERYDIHGNPLDGILPSDRTHYFKVYGSYAFPFGLTVGVVGYGRSGLPETTTLSFNDMQVFPDGYFDTGERIPFLFWADLYLEYNLRSPRSTRSTSTPRSATSPTPPPSRATT